jgi:hypothetical protein
VHENFLAYSGYGSKGDFGSHDIQAYGNYYAYVDSAWSGWSTRGHYVNNTVILRGATGGYLSDCGLVGHPELGEISGNTLYSADSAMYVPCLNATRGAGCVGRCPLNEWLVAGHDVGTSLAQVPPEQAVMAAARVLLGL